MSDRALVSNASGKVEVSSVSSTELSYLSGATAHVQTQLDSKEDIISGAASTVTTADLNLDRVVVSDGSGKIAASSVSTTELNYLTGVSSGIQAQLDSKEHAISGAASSITTSDLSANQVVVSDGSGKISN